ncbi:hypothetical protein [Methylorubrum populi]|uniref:Uncharacterized protein n=1 Tax=Methylorubrum populi TaxID=223967 RepID=A0A833JCG7_9HYPH|nr:hypothetical protein [Methylorubrum populi]KAB7788001.1 hypothetical protein F8B43_0006 [Methylorubrum populi]
MLSQISANTLIWWAAFGPAIVLSLIAFTANHVADVRRARPQTNAEVL